MARDHHYQFAHVLLRNQFLASPGRVTEELSGPMRDAFLFYLWQELGKVVDEPLPHVALAGEDEGQPEMRKLEVFGVDEDVPSMKEPRCVTRSNAPNAAARTSR